MQAMSNMTATTADAAVALRGALRTPAGAVHWSDAAAPAPALAWRHAARAAPALTVKMLDGFRVWQGSEPLLALPHGRVRALLKLLLLQRRRPISRTRLAALFWPEADADSARNNLHVALHRLRRALGSAARLHLGDEGYQLVTPGEAWLDTEQFVQHAEAGLHEERAGRAPEAIAQYEAALALYHRDLLEEGEWENALAAEAQALRDRLNEVLERLAALREQRADWHDCLRVGLRHLSLDESNELAHQRLMRCYGRLGQVQMAEQQYRQCVQALRQRLDLAPSTETTMLYRRIATRCAA